MRHWSIWIRTKISYIVTTMLLLLCINYRCKRLMNLVPTFGMTHKSFSMRNAIVPSLWVILLMKEGNLILFAKIFSQKPFTIALWVASATKTTKFTLDFIIWDIFPIVITDLAITMKKNIGRIRRSSMTGMISAKRSRLFNCTIKRSRLGVFSYYKKEEARCVFLHLISTKEKPWFMMRSNAISRPFGNWINRWSMRFFHGHLVTLRCSRALDPSEACRMAKQSKKEILWICNFLSSFLILILIVK